MSRPSVATAVKPVLVLTAFTLLADLFLGWREASVRAPGVALDAAASAWSGPGAVAGVLLVAVLVLEVADRSPVAAGALGLLASVFTFAEFLTGEAHVQAGGVVSVGAGAHLWPAYLGLALAVVLAAAAAARIAAHIELPDMLRPHHPA